MADKYLSVKVSQELYNTIANLAKSHDRSVAGEIRHIFKGYVRGTEAKTDDG